MGTGKTVMTSVAMRLLFRRAQIRRALVICPVGVLQVWDEHLMEWAPELFVTVVHGQRKMRRIDWATPAHVYLTTYDTLRADMQSGILPKEMWDEFDLVVVDEIQHAKNPASKPDIVAIFGFLKPGLLEDDDPPAVIGERAATYFLRRRKRDILPDLPPKQRQARWLSLSRDQERAYRAVEAQIRGDFIGWQERGEKIPRLHILAAIGKLKQICNFAPGRTTSPKTYALLNDIVEEVAASGSKVIVFSQYMKEGIGKLESLLEPYGVAKVVGGQSRAVRDAEVDRFRNDPKTHVLLATITSGRVGLALTEPSYIVHSHPRCS
jgi:SNF2 family DNA or RNA helicase